MTTNISIDTEIAHALGEPATEDQAGYEAMSWATGDMGDDVTIIGAYGDSAEDITAQRIKGGRTVHFNGGKDGGSQTITSIRNDENTGQAFVEQHANTNATVSTRITQADGVVRYSYGRLANVLHPERTASTYDGFVYDYRRNSDDTKVSP